jgi:cellobiose transport system substrate-binding protein
VTAIPGGGGAAGGMQLVIPAASDDAREAYDLLTWLLSPDNQREAFERHGVFPSRPELYDSPAITTSTSGFFSGAPVGAILADATREGHPLVEGPQQRPIEREFEGVLGAVEDGKVAADVAWDAAIRNVAQAIQG